MSLQTAAEFARMLTEAEPQVLAASNTPVDLLRLTSREQEWWHCRQGRTDTQIAAQLYISGEHHPLPSESDLGQDQLPAPADLTRLALQAGLVQAARHGTSQPAYG
jgi:hypothetical protein